MQWKYTNDDCTDTPLSICQCKCESKNTENPILTTSRLDKLDKSRLAIDKLMNCIISDDYEQTYSHISTMSNRYKVINHNRTKALRTAIKYSSFNIFKILLDNGADLIKSDALLVASTHGKLSIVKFILETMAKNKYNKYFTKYTDCNYYANAATISYYNGHLDIFTEFCRLGVMTHIMCEKYSDTDFLQQILNRGIVYRKDCLSDDFFNYIITNIIKYAALHDNYIIIDIIKPHFDILISYSSCEINIVESLRPDSASISKKIIKYIIDELYAGYNSNVQRDYHKIISDLTDIDKYYKTDSVCIINNIRHICKTKFSSAKR